jgi:hypothetical protein
VEHLRRSLLLDFALEICVLASDDQRRISSREHTPERFLLLDATEPVSGSLLLNASPFGMPVRGVVASLDVHRVLVLRVADSNVSGWAGEGGD